jgi:hypothetical protein
MQRHGRASEKQGIAALRPRMPTTLKRSRVRHLAGRDIHIHHHRGTAPALPAGTRNTLVCPQCVRRTWRYSRHCMHCRLDLWLWRIGHALLLGLRAVLLRPKPRPH